MKGFLHQLFDYNFYCNRKLIEQFAQMGTVPEKCIRLFSSILNVHHVWNHRILGEPSDFKVSQVQELKNWESIHYENQRTSFEIITNTDDFNKRIDYENDKSRVFGSEIKDILFHIINNATHHRGQILMDFQSFGIESELLDYIFYRK